MSRGDGVFRPPPTSLCAKNCARRWARRNANETRSRPCTGTYMLLCSGGVSQRDVRRVPGDASKARATGIFATPTYSLIHERRPCVKIDVLSHLCRSVGGPEATSEDTESSSTAARFQLVRRFSLEQAKAVLIMPTVRVRGGMARVDREISPAMRGDDAHAAGAQNSCRCRHMRFPGARSTSRAVSRCPLGCTPKSHSRHDPSFLLPVNHRACS